MSWKLSPEDLIDEAYLPSLWTVQKTVRLALSLAILGPLSITRLRHAKPDAHKRMAIAPRKRKPQATYLLEMLS